MRHYKISFKKFFVGLVFVILLLPPAMGQNSIISKNDFALKGFHLDLRIQVMPLTALKSFAKKLSTYGINTLIMEWEATYPFEKHPLIANRYAYSKDEIKSFIKYCDSLSIDVIPLQQSFGHVEYILRHYRYADLREDEKNYSQVCPLETRSDSLLFTDLYKELIATHHSPYIHIGGDETLLLGHCDKCKLKAAAEGVSRLYIDYIKMLCTIVIGLGKRPVLWADIALKYPEALPLLPKETIFIDWNYGWDLNRFGDHKKLIESGFEIWGAPSLRSHPDNYFLTQWEKHFNNIRDFVPVARNFGYKGIVMTSWSTSGGYSSVFEAENSMIDLYAIRHVYPLSGFNILLAAYTESLLSNDPLDVEGFIQKYCTNQYGLNKAESDSFWSALKTTPYEVVNGEVKLPGSISLNELTDSTIFAATTLHTLKPAKNSDEFEHYRLMFDIRVQYLLYLNIEKQVNSATFTNNEIPEILQKLKNILINEETISRRFTNLNKNFLYSSELEEENKLRTIKINLLYERLHKKK